MKNKKYYSAIYQIIKTGHWITDRVSTELKDFGISEPQYNVLKILKGSKGKPLTVQEILVHMVQKSSNVTRIVDKLLEKKLLIRQECPTNRRKQEITITDQGEKLLIELDKKVKSFHLPMQENVTEKEAQLISNLISKLKGNKV